MHPYPLIRSGGLFVLVIGGAIAAGAVWPRRRWILFAIGLALATFVTILTASDLVRPLGQPKLHQIVAVAAALTMEGLLILFAARRFRQQDRRAFDLSILSIVGLHFLPMAIAFGPLLGALGLALMANAGVGLAARRVSSTVFWGADGLLKIAFGTVMLLGG